MRVKEVGEGEDLKGESDEGGQRQMCVAHNCSAATHTHN